MLYQWGRFVYWATTAPATLAHWLNTNSGGIQALSSLVTLFLTFYLAKFTILSLHTAEKALSISQQQLRASLQPKVSVELKTMYPLSPVEIKYLIKNIGTEPVDLWNLSIVLVWNHKAGTERKVINVFVHPWRVLLPTEEVGDVYSVHKEVPELIDRFGSIVDQFMEVEVHVDCSDLDRTQDHSFFRTNKGNVFRHSNSFFGPTAKD